MPEMYWTDGRQNPQGAGVSRLRKMNSSVCVIVAFNCSDPRVLTFFFLRLSSQRCAQMGIVWFWSVFILYLDAQALVNVLFSYQLICGFISLSGYN